MEVKTMEDILKNKELCYIFREFVHEQYNSENFSFWLEVECYHRLKNPALRVERAQEIWKRYFDPNSKDEINVEARHRKSIEERLSTAPIDLFDDTQRYIWKVMSDQLPTFLESAKYQKFKAKGLIDYRRPSVEQGIKEYEVNSVKPSRSLTVWMVEDYFANKTD